MRQGKSHIFISKLQQKYFVVNLKSSSRVLYIKFQLINVLTV